jgi:hypothetical protein
MHAVSRTLRLSLGFVALVGAIFGVQYYLQARLTAEDCTKYEKYDAWSGSCYFDCYDDTECADVQKKIDAELDSFFADSKVQTAKLDATPAPVASSTPVAAVSAEPTVTPSTAETSTTSVAQLTLADTESETRGTVYTVTPDQELTPEPDQTAKQLWQLFSKVATREFIASYIQSFEVFSDANNDTMASVWLSTTPTKWHMNVNTAFMNDRKDLIHTMVHELGHVATLNVKEVDPGVASCPHYLLDEGCAKEGSLVNAFYQRYWAKYGALAMPSRVHAQESEEDEVPAEDEEMMETTSEPLDDAAPTAEGGAPYNPSEFVSEYAATNPVEDLAETYAFFILRSKPTGSEIKDQKIQMLYTYPELVSVRNRIRGALASEI